MYGKPFSGTGVKAYKVPAFPTLVPAGSIRLSVAIQDPKSVEDSHMHTYVYDTHISCICI